MASGTSALLWYLLCGSFVTFCCLVAFGLVKVGERRQRRQLEERDDEPSS